MYCTIRHKNKIHVLHSTSILTKQQHFIITFTHDVTILLNLTLVFIIRVKLRANRFKRGFAKTIGILFRKVYMRFCGLAEYICFSQDVNILSSLQFNIIELVIYGY